MPAKMMISLALALVVPLMGCAALESADRSRGALRIKATVTTMDSADEQGRYRAGQAIDGAAISTICDGRSPRLLGHSNEAGRFQFWQVDRLGRDCALRISHRDYQTRTYAVETVCAMPRVREDHKSQCSYVSLSARLMPDGEAQ